MCDLSENLGLIVIDDLPEMIEWMNIKTGSRISFNFSTKQGRDRMNF